MITLTLCGGCVFGPDPVGIVTVDHPPYIEPNSVVPNTAGEPSVVFNLSESDRVRQFQILGVYDWDPNEVLTYAYVLRIGTGAQISVPAATEARPRLRVSAEQPMPYATRYESSQLAFDPCSYRDVVDGVARYGTIQMIIYDAIDTYPAAEGFEREDYTVRWTWPLEFQGQCPLCTTNTQCFEDEVCTGGVCVPG